ncbi:MAG: VWA domain-containing protein [Ruminococcus sp.]|nr:VWA domain-containing protein [Ruminococcus sp.]
MAEKISAAEAISRQQKKGSGKKKLWILFGVIVVIVVIISVITSIQVVSNSKIEKAKAVVAQIDLNTTYKQAEFRDGDDWDTDGVANGSESKSGTNPQNEDTDGDGISDGAELELGTDALNPDTDKDGMLDGYEIMAGTDPKNPKTDGTTSDGSRKVTIDRTYGEVSVEITGSPNVADITIEKLDLTSISSNSSIVTKAYDIYTDFSYDKLTATFTVNKEKLSKVGASFGDLTVLKFNSAEKKYEKIDSRADEAAGTVSADLSELGVYVVGIERTANEEPSTRIAFLIDNSGSMYAEFTGYDVEFKRLDFASELISKLEGDYTFMISKFTADYTRLTEFTNDKSKLTASLDSIRNGSETFNGTHSQSSLEKCIAEFTGGTHRDMIVFLTDGESDEPNPKTLAELTKLANDKSITILTVGLGRDIDRTWLQQLAAGTGGKYYSAFEANALTDVYKQIETTLDYDMVSYNNNDDKIEGYSLYNTGFKPETNGFSFKDFRTTSASGVDFGMAVFARDWYLGNMKMTLGEVDPKQESNLKYKAAGYDMTGTQLEESYNARKPLSSIITTAFTGELTDVKQYLDFKSGGNILQVSDSKLEKAQKSGWAVQEYPIEGSAIEWKRVQLLSLDVANSSDKIASAYSKWEAELYKALHTLNALQWDDEEYEFNLTSGDDGFERLKTMLAEGIPVVTTIDDSHTVNAIGLIQDSTAHRKYILQVYDSNYPSKVKEIYITRSPIAVCTVADGKATVSSTTFEYSTTYEGKQVGLSFSDVKY